MTAVPIILNPTAGGGRLLRCRAELDRAARAQGVDLRWIATEHPGHAEALARHEADRGVGLVLAFGGDGTYNEVARGLVGSPSALGVLPGGTTSVLAYELGIPRPAPRALASLLSGTDRAMRPGRTDRGDLFLLMLSSGPDALVLTRVDARLKRLGGRVGVALTAAREMLRAGPMPRVRCHWDGGSLAAGWVVVGRSRSYAGPFHATPGADPFAGPLEMVVQRRSGRGVALRFAADLVRGRHVHRDDVSRFMTSRIQLEPDGDGAAPPYQVDGDPVAVLPVEIGIDDRWLRVRLPG